MARLPNSLEAENPLQPLLDQHRRYVAALRAGGFVCFLPGFVDPTWDHMACQLALFPFVIQFTMGGRAADEPAKAWQTCEDVGAHRVYVWTPVTGAPPGESFLP